MLSPSGARPKHLPLVVFKKGDKVQTKADASVRTPFKGIIVANARGPNTQIYYTVQCDGFSRVTAGFNLELQSKAES